MDEKTRPESCLPSDVSSICTQHHNAVLEAPIKSAGVTLQDDKQNNPTDGAPAWRRDWRFWCIMLTLSLGMLLVSLETTVVVTSLPTIAAELHIGENYIWVSNAFLLTSTAVVPLFGQLCDLFGRRNILTLIFAAYTLGSGIAAGANNSTMLIAGRALQGIGSGGLNTAGDIVIADLVPLRYRGNYMAVLFTVALIGYGLGPIIGGEIVQRTTWRWVFWLNLPISGLGIVFAWFFLGNLKTIEDESFLRKIRRIDWVGNGILIAATVSILIAQTWGGALYAWSDYHVLVPLLVGAAGLFGFVLFEASGIPSHPVLPLRLFPNWTSRIIFVNTFSNTLLTFWVFYFLPLYFQGVQLSSPTRSGVQLLPVTLVALPGAILSAILISRFGRYKVLHLAGLAIESIGVGLCGTLDEDSSTGAWVGFQIIAAFGSGFLLTTLLPAFQASTDESDQAMATSAFNFIRLFGYIWGVAVAGAIFNSYTSRYAYMVDDEAVKAILRSGDGYSSATREFVTQFPEPVRGQIRHVFSLSLSKVFIISVAFGGFACLLTLLEKDVKLRNELDTKYGMKERVSDHRLGDKGAENVDRI